jgi:hypothetical protein
MPPKAGDRVAPPASPGKWTLQFADSDTGGDWETLVQNIPSAALACYDTLSDDPLAYSNRQRRLRGELGAREIGGKTLPQWQLEITSGGRVWYCPDEDRRLVHLTLVSMTPPKATHPNKDGR